MANLEIIRARWQQAAKVAGLQNVVTLANGEQLKGCYTLTESGSATASHDVLNGFMMSAGFPTDGNGGSVNDRDYWHDHDAQQITRDIARNYDGRALQSPVVVSPDGVILSGNGRTMAGELAAHDGTDGAYISHLVNYCAQFGFTPDQVAAFAHPRVLFELENALPYTAATFAKFNQQEMKGQNKTEQAIKFGKTVNDETFGRIVATINGFETLGDFYACTEAATRCLNDLRTAGVIDAMTYATLFDGDTISAAGKETLENVLIGKAFADNPDAARQLTTYKSLRKSVVFALSEVANCLRLGDGYALTFELSQAINLAYIARQHGYKAGERVSNYARQIDAFSAETICDCKDTVILTLADALNDDKVTLLKRILAVYNHQAADAANGQTDMFCTSGVKTKAEILQEVKALFATGSTKEQNAAVSASVETRTAANLFIADELTKEVRKGSFVQYRTKAGDSIVCKVDALKGTIAYLIGKGGIKFWCSVSDLIATADHNLSLPEWLTPGNVITDGKSASQRIIAISDTHVMFEWLNGGYFEAAITTVLQGWHPSANGVCEVLEIA